MTGNEQYAAVLLPDTYRVLGYTMQVVTVGHMVLLYRLGSPFVVAPQDEGPAYPQGGDLALGIAICIRPFPDAIKMVNSRGCAAKVRRIRIPNAVLLDGILQFRDYIARSTAGPDTAVVEEPGSRNIDAPMLQIIRLTLMSRLGYSDDDVMTTPVAEALWDVAGLAAMAGRLVIVDDDAKRAREQALLLLEELESTGKIPKPGTRHA